MYDTKYSNASLSYNISRNLQHCQKNVQFLILAFSPSRHYINLKHHLNFSTKAGEHDGLKIKS